MDESIQCNSKGLQKTTIDRVNRGTNSKVDETIEL
jgi:hypothetical protein